MGPTSGADIYKGCVYRRTGLVKVDESNINPRCSSTHENNMHLTLHTSTNMKIITYALPIITTMKETSQQVSLNYHLLYSKFTLLQMTNAVGLREVGSAPPTYEQ